MAYTRPSASAADASFQGAGAYTRPDHDGADASFLAASPEGLISLPAIFGHSLCIGSQSFGYASTESMLGVILVQGYGVSGWASAAAILGAANVTGAIPMSAWAAAPSVLGAARSFGYHDFTGLIGDSVTSYVMDLVTPGGTVRVPISSWQATLQTGASNYVQCVVPAVAAWAASIGAATEFVVYRRAAIPQGEPIEYEMARSPLGQVSMARGPTNFTATLSGYSTAFAEDEAPDAAYDRTLAGIRSVTTGTSATRVRCAIDWLLRPGQRAYYGAGAAFVARYINYYVPATGDAYMDVGE